jgi:hypothetical protein
MMSMASTKEVPTNGIISVSHGQCDQMANKKAAVEIKKISQYKPRGLCFTSMCLKFLQT